MPQKELDDALDEKWAELSKAVNRELNIRSLVTIAISIGLSTLIGWWLWG